MPLGVPVVVNANVTPDRGHGDSEEEVLNFFKFFFNILTL